MRILMILPTFDYAGGIESFVMNNIRCFGSDVSVDVLSHEISAKKYVDEVKARGGNVFNFPRFSLSSINDISSRFKRLLQTHSYDIIHCHMANAAFLYLRIANQNGIKVRIIHSHQERAADTILHALRNYPLLKIGKKYANVYLACSQNAGRFLFKDCSFNEIDNGIDYDKFRYSEMSRVEIRKELGIAESEIAVVHTGRFCPQKNQLLLLKIFKEFHMVHSNAVLYLVGDGEDKNKILGWIKEYQLDDSVKMIGIRTDIEKILSGMDLFLFPSLYEGLPISLLEAQASSLPCVCSDTIPRETDISGNISFVSLHTSLSVWIEEAEKLLKSNIRNKDIELRKEHSVEYGAKKLYDIYKRSLVNEDTVNT